MKLSVNDFPDSRTYFSALPKADLNNLQIKHFEPGAVIIAEGTVAHNSLYLILSGVCFGEKKKPSSHKDRTIHHKFHKNQYVGVHELLSTRIKPSRITIYAKTDVYALNINKQTLNQWQTHNPALFNNIISMILEQHFDTQNILLNCMNHHPFAAFVYYLTQLYEIYLYSCYKTGFAGNVKIHDTHDELCYYSGKSVRTINRYIRQLQEDNLISIIRGKLHVNRQQYQALLSLLEKLS